MQRQHCAYSETLFNCLNFSCLIRSTRPAGSQMLQNSDCFQLYTWQKPRSSLYFYSFRQESIIYIHSFGSLVAAKAKDDKWLMTLCFNVNNVCVVSLFYTKHRKDKRAGNDLFNSVSISSNIFILLLNIYRNIKQEQKKNVIAALTCCILFHCSIFCDATVKWLIQYSLRAEIPSWLLRGDHMTCRRTRAVFLNY